MLLVSGIETQLGKYFKLTRKKPPSFTQPPQSEAGLYTLPVVSAGKPTFAQDYSPPADLNHFFPLEKGPLATVITCLLLKWFLEYKHAQFPPSLKQTTNGIINN